MSISYQNFQSFSFYSAKLSQPGNEDNPTVSVLTNSLGESVAWSRLSQGNYAGDILLGTFLAAGTFCSAPAIDLVAQVSQEYYATLARGTNNRILLNVFDLSGTPVDGFNNLTIEVKVYPAT